MNGVMFHVVAFGKRGLRTGSMVPGLLSCSFVRLRLRPATGDLYLCSVDHTDQSSKTNSHK